MSRLSPIVGLPGVERAVGRLTDARRNVWMLWRRGALAAAGAHVIFLAVFLALGLPTLVWLNVASVAVHLASHRLSVLERHVPAVVLLVAEIVLHAAIATRLLGHDSGFHFYVLTLILPLLVTVDGSVVRRLLSVVPLAVFYAMLDACTQHAAPILEVAPVFVDALRYFNIAGMFVVMAFVALTYHGLVTDAEKSLHALATTDPLTGLNNRRRMLDIGRSLCASGAPESGGGLCVLLCDIDHFKTVNDRHGHDVGDRALAEISQALNASMRKADVVGRWGGEEFLVLATGADLRLAAEVGERLRQAVARARVELPDGPALALTITIGVAELAPGETIAGAIARADAALYRGKAEGRNRVVTASGTSGIAAVQPVA